MPQYYENRWKTKTLNAQQHNPFATLSNLGIRSQLAAAEY